MMGNKTKQTLLWPNGGPGAELLGPEAALVQSGSVTSWVFDPRRQLSAFSCFVSSRKFDTHNYPSSTWLKNIPGNVCTLVNKCHVQEAFSKYCATTDT